MSSIRAKFRTYDHGQSQDQSSLSPVKCDGSSGRSRIKSQASIVSFAGSSQKLRPADHENDVFLRRFAVNNDDVTEDNIKYHSLCFGM